MASLEPFALLPSEEAQERLPRKLKLSSSQVKDVYPCTSLQAGLKAISKSMRNGFKLKARKTTPDVASFAKTFSH
ncbi:uncharacterized protein BDR25DRAFT_396835 [Lindgomyces ingoldianus]|uniref:Uncharacterized protein n=1 Tax=Lindgomyces ingoldianus TaxID=673940 RepID=A0ACB6QDB6_9PLEO|nr:uncharacterized protein BDR25DRAFT_396835 [Lindgomyces ingoldianus]KAF2464135.1 hypothetical protein BDR25DRAFT_396835 [Lindgomyces ingoldianus]